MAIYSCNLASVGRTTHAAGTAGAHLRYIGREDAVPVLGAHAMPSDPVEARAWMDRQETHDRKNARVLDKVRVALPRELTKEQRQQLVRDFCERVTGNQVPWMYAIHQEGKDAHNPHAHIVIRDRDIETGKRVIRLSDSARDREAVGLEPKAVEWIRIAWEQEANRALEVAGHQERVDRRTLEAQGIDREPTIHLGPRGQFIDEQVQRPRSQKRTNALGREIDYPAIDQGRTRKERQAEIIDLNLERDTRSVDPKTRALARFEKEQRSADRRLERELADMARKRTQEERAALATFRAETRAIRMERQVLLREARIQHVAQRAPALLELREKQAAEREALRRRQSTLWAKLTRAVDVTGGTRHRHKEAVRILVRTHQEERGELTRKNREAWQHVCAQVRSLHAPYEQHLAEQRETAFVQLREKRLRIDAMMDARRQLREAARERERTRLERWLRQERDPAIRAGDEIGRDQNLIRPDFSGPRRSR